MIRKLNKHYYYGFTFKIIQVPDFGYIKGKLLKIKLRICNVLAIEEAPSNFITGRKTIKYGYYPEGTYYVKNQYINGKLNGWCYKYYRYTGTVEAKFPYINGNIDGWVYFYYPTGEIKTKTLYHYNKIVKYSYMFFRNGKIKVIFPYNKKNKVHGWVTQYNRYGKIVMRRKLVNDEIVQTYYY